MLAFSGFNGFGQFAVDGQRSGNTFRGAEMLIFFCWCIWSCYMEILYVL